MPIHPDQDILTPWGPLTECFGSLRKRPEQVMFWDKHQRIEGTTFELWVQQFFKSMPTLRTGSTRLPPITIGISRSTLIDRNQSGAVFVLLHPDPTPHRHDREIMRLVRMLHRHFEVWLLRFDHDKQTFMMSTRPWSPGGPNPMPGLPAGELLRNLGRRNPVLPNVSLRVRDLNRQQKSYWGYIRSSLRDFGTLLERVVLPRIFLNFVLTPFLPGTGLWDVDLVQSVPDHERVLVWDIKHKYPFGRHRLQFGMNSGQRSVYALLADCGIEVFHAIVVKPVWSDRIGPDYLMNDHEARERALIIGTALTPEHLRKIGSRGIRQSGAKTTMYGSGTNSYHPLPVTDFHVVGNLQDTTAHLGRQLEVLAGIDIASEELPRLGEQELRRRKLDDDACTGKRPD